MSRRSNSYRLGEGEVTTEDGRRAKARMCFLEVLDRLYPACLDDLLALRDVCIWEHPRTAESEYTATEYSRAAQPIKAWARRWRLLDRGQPADWIVEGAWRALYYAHRHPNWPREFLLTAMYPGWGGPALIQSDEDKTILPPISACELERLPRSLRKVAIVCEDRLVFEFNPEAWRAAWFKRCLRAAARFCERKFGVSVADACRRVDEIVEQARKQGGKLSEWKCEPAHFEWAVRALVGRESYEIISREPVKVSPFAVRNAVQRVLETVGLRRSPCGQGS